MAREAACDYPQRTDSPRPRAAWRTEDGERELSGEFDDIPGRVGVCASAMLDSTRFSPRFDVGKGEEASCGSATPDEAGESLTEARPGGCADDDGQLVAAPGEAGESPTEARSEGCAGDDGQLVAAPASKGGRMPHEKL